MNAKRLFFAAVLFAVLSAADISCSRTAESAVPFGVKNAADSGGIALTALNENARAGETTAAAKSPWMYFLFPPEVSRIFSYSAHCAVLKVSVRFAEEGGIPNPDLPFDFALGYLYADDFSPKNSARLKKTLADRNLVSGFNLFSAAAQTGSGVIELVFANNRTDVRGFMIFSARPAKIAAASVETDSGIRAGYRKTGQAFRLYFPESGGSVNAAFSVRDSRNGGGEALLPELTYRFAEPVSSGALYVLYGDSASEGAAPSFRLQMSLLNNDAASVSVRRAAGQTRQLVNPAGFASPVISCTAAPNAENTPDGLVYIPDDYPHRAKASVPVNGASSAPAPIAADPGQIIVWPAENWRHPDFEIFSWDRFPSVMIFDTADYAVQDLFFKRLAFFAEKKGYAGRLAFDHEIAREHGYNAHDYNAATLASFFDLAEKEQFPLNEYELILRGALLSAGIIEKSAKNASGFCAGSGAVVSVSRESPPYLRNMLMVHEGLHGLYFTHADFREQTAKIYAACDKTSVLFLKRYFEVTPSLLYDTENEYLMQNEFMSYLLQQPVSAAERYFSENIASRRYIGAAEPDLTQYIRTTKAAAFADAAAKLDSYIAEKWGLAAGRISLVTVRY
ncbi:MAG: hypothetical protein NC041_09230 [Bacteroides sp.]|nr:hypothetical protein [Prevotella sp.]MCM1408718.1 hypothetical protein [Treponema brennaborense]MCM1470633.1 hypothetical protein [Bacteroides sp.]